MDKKSVDQWFDEYGECHQNRTNKRIHWICVPLIMASILALLSELPIPSVLRPIPSLNWATVVVAASLIFYFRLSMNLAVGMLIVSFAILYGIAVFRSLNILPVWQCALGVFVIAWIGQAIGHLIEGKKPSFFADLQFLLIGPIWLLSSIFRTLRIPY